MIRLEMKNYNATLTEKHQKYLYFNQIKLIKVKVLHAKNHYLLMKLQ